jgi:hypothetical protein
MKFPGENDILLITKFQVLIQTEERSSFLSKKMQFWLTVKIINFRLR